MYKCQFIEDAMNNPLRTLIDNHRLSPEEIARRKEGAQRLKEQYQSIPWYAERGRKYGDKYWEMLYASSVLR